MILVTDANILITLFDVDGVSVLPKIAPTEVLDVVLLECEHDSQPGLREAVEAAGIGIIPSDMTWTSPARQMMDGRLSFPDALCLFYAKSHGRVLLSGDRPLRNRCEKEGVEYRGTIWVVQEVYEKGFLPPEELCRWIRTWPLMERRLPQAELDRLKKDMGC